MVFVCGRPPRLEPGQEIVDGQAFVLVVGVRERRERKLTIPDILRRHVRATGFYDEGKVLRCAQEIGN